MKVAVCASKLTVSARRLSLLSPNCLLRAGLAGLALCLSQAYSAHAALSFKRGAVTAVGCTQFANSPDSVIITGALTSPGTITSGLNIPANRIQYDVINCDQGAVSSWTVFYSPLVGPNMIGAYTPLGYLTSGGTIVPQGGYAYTTLFNSGYGVYNYNTGAPWTIDYEPDHITFTRTPTSPGLPANDGVGYLDPAYYLPSFAILFQPDLANGLVPASEMIGTANFTGQVYGPLPGNACISIHCTNLVVQTCSSCVPVSFTASALDTCCSNVVLQYQPPPGTCFPVNSTTTVTVTAHDSCGNNATNYFTVTVNQDPNCAPTNCISIYSSNIVVYTCNPCTPVAYNVFAVDNCCSTGAPFLTFNPPTSTCFPQNSSTPVQVVATDPCGNSATNSFTVTVLPGPDCGNTNCISIHASNIVLYACSSCATVPFNATAVDRCCSNVVLTYNPPTNTCFPLNSTTTVQIQATDDCNNSATKFITVTVLPAPGCNPTNCITIYASNIVVYTCSNCTFVPYSASALDTCCSAGATLSFNPPETTCFPLNTATTVNVTASDPCGNAATGSFTVTVLPGPDCPPTNCISLLASNIVVYTCSNCVTVPFNAYAYDSCCTNSTGTGPTIVYNPPATTCFPRNSTTPVKVSAFDNCGNTATKFFTVTILPGPSCGGTNSPLSITGLGGPGGSSTNYITIYWPATNGLLLQSPDLMHWTPIPDGTNSPYLVPIYPPKTAEFYRLQYR